MCFLSFQDLVVSFWNGRHVTIGGHLREFMYAHMGGKLWPEMKKTCAQRKLSGSMPCPKLLQLENENKYFWHFGARWAGLLKK